MNPYAVASSNAVEEPEAYVVHELMHFIESKQNLYNSEKNLHSKFNFKSKQIAGKVSDYAKENASEFIAETGTGLLFNQKYNPKVLKMYKDLGGPIPEKSKIQFQNI